MASTPISNKDAFGIVTVMDVKVYAMSDVESNYGAATTRSEADTAIIALYDAASANKALCTIDHLQVATLSTDGPSITINGGKYNNPLLKYGKTARCEMTDALAQADALVHLGGAEWDASKRTLSITDKFGAPVCVVGKTFVVDQKTGKHVSAHVILYKFLPDSTLSFAFDSGNAATFDLNGDLLAVEFGVSGDEPEECADGTGVFFSIVLDDCSLAPIA